MPSRHVLHETYRITYSIKIYREIFAIECKITKTAKVFPLESFAVYGSLQHAYINNYVYTQNYVYLLHLICEASSMYAASSSIHGSISIMYAASSLSHHKLCKCVFTK